MERFQTMVVSSPNMHALLAALCAFALAGNALAETLQPRLAKYVTSADGTRIYAEAQGNVSAPPIIFVHGITASGLAFDDLFNREDLQKAAYLVRYDDRGHGRSAKPTDPASYESARYAQDIEAVIEAFNLTMPFFAGWSLAGAIIADIAAYWSNPIPFRGFIYISGVPYLDGTPLPITAASAALLPDLLIKDNTAVALSARTTLSTRLSVKGADVDFATLALWSGVTMYMMPEITELVFSRSHNSTPLRQLAESGFPTLLISGASDAIIDAQASSALLKQNFTNLRTFVYPDAGHAVFYDQPDKFVHDIITFVQNNTVGILNSTIAHSVADDEGERVLDEELKLSLAMNPNVV